MYIMINNAMCDDYIDIGICVCVRAHVINIYTSHKLVRELSLKAFDDSYKFYIFINVSDR